MSRPIAVTLLLGFTLGSVLAFAGAQTNQGDRCVTSTGFDGTCINIYQCEPLLRMLQQVPLDPTDLAYLRSTQCGVDGKDPKVCCVPETTPVGPVGFV